MNIRITPTVFEALPPTLRVELRRSVPVRVVILGRDAEDAASRLRALGHTELAEDFLETLAPLEKAVGK